MFRRIELKRARLAHECVTKVAAAEEYIEKVGEKFTSYVRRLLAAIPTDGILSTLTFCASQAKASNICEIAKWIESVEEALAKLPSDKAAYAIIYYYIAKRLSEKMELDINVSAEPLELIGQLAGDYKNARKASRESMAFLIWVKRFAEAEFGAGR
jgi:CRISPR type III-B/RAMP module-associated protein Cmr5